MTNEPKEPEYDALLGTLLGDRYRVLRVIGEGGMGRVYEGRHTLIKRRVAIKVLRTEVASEPEFVERFLNEGRLAGTLGHPHIVASTDMGYSDDGAPFLVYEFLEGESLATTLAREGALDAKRVATIGVQLASALRTAHAAGIVHRDMKPENIHRGTRDGADFCTVLDFGISKITGPGAGQTRRGQLLGTPEYMAPEQINDTDTVDGRTDVYALGCVLYAMIAGRAPFDSAPLSELLHTIVTQGPRPLRSVRPHVDEALESIVERCMQRAPKDRFASMAEVEKALRKYLELCAGPEALRSVPPPPPSHAVDVGAATMPVISGKTSPMFLQRATTLDEDPLRVSGSNVTPGFMVSPAPRPARLAGKRKASAVVPALVVILGLVVGSSVFLLFRRGPAAEVSGVESPTGEFGGTQLGNATPAPLPPVSAPVRPAPTGTVSLHVVCKHPGAQARFRGVAAALPLSVDTIRPGTTETIEVTAPGHQGLRFHVDFQGAISLDVVLPTGSGLVDATANEFAAAEARADQKPDPRPADHTASPRPAKTAQAPTATITELPVRPGSSAIRELSPPHRK